MNCLVRLHEPEDWTGVALCRSEGGWTKAFGVAASRAAVHKSGIPDWICGCRNLAHGDLGSALGAEQELLGRVFVDVSQNPFPELTLQRKATFFRW